MLPMPPPLPLPMPKPRELPAIIKQIGYDKMRVKVDAELSRVEAFRLIGQLERMAALL